MIFVNDNPAARLLATAFEPNALQRVCAGDAEIFFERRRRFNATVHSAIDAVAAGEIGQQCGWARHSKTSNAIAFRLHQIGHGHVA
jgi:hypothetical protein